LSHQVKSGILVSQVKLTKVISLNCLYDLHIKSSLQLFKVPWSQISEIGKSVLCLVLLPINISQDFTDKLYELPYKKHEDTRTPKFFNLKESKVPEHLKAHST
jgi:hypothetical protein